MSGKFIKIKKVVIPILVMVTILAQSISASAFSQYNIMDVVKSTESVVVEVADVTSNTVTTASTSRFTDLANYKWAEAAINDMAAQGVLMGVGNNKFAPANNVKRQEFAVMAIRAAGGDVEELARQASAKAAEQPDKYTSLETINEVYGPGWSNSLICATQMFPELDTLWGVSKEAWTADANRGEMAFIVLTIYEQLTGETLEITDGIEYNIGDYTEVSGSPYKQYIMKAYSNGIMAGTNNNGDFKAYANSNRAQAAVVIQKMTDPSMWTKVEVKVPETVIKDTAVITFDTPYNSPDFRAVYPKEGDTFKGKVIERDPDTGILGLNVKGGIYEGIKLSGSNSSPIITSKDNYVKGDYSKTYEAKDNYDNMASGSWYLTYGQYTFWGSEWDILFDYAKDRLPAPNASIAGSIAGVKGEILDKKDADEAMWVCVYHSTIGVYQWKNRESLDDYLTSHGMSFEEIVANPVIE